MLNFRSMRKITKLFLFMLIASSTIAQPTEGVTGEGKTKDGKKVGKWIYTCDVTGKEVGTEKYDGDGLLDGYATWYDCDGNILAEYNYEHGKKLGDQKEYYPFNRKVKREWSMIERPKKCQKTKADKEATDIEWYKSYYESGKLEVEWEGEPCGQRTITKHRETGGTHWTIEYDREGNYKFGPRDEERKINSEEIR